MVLDGSFVLLGFVLLVLGGEALVRGASGIALLARVGPAVVGLTIVAMGTSMPELVVSVNASLRGSPALAVGNVVGSNIFNIGAILGIAALIRPLRIRGNAVRLEWPVMILASFQLHLLARDSMVDRLEGGFLVAGLAAFVAYAVWIGRKEVAPVERQELSELTTASFGRTGAAAWTSNGAAVVVGIALLAVGSSVLVHGATGLARDLGVSETIIGLTLVAAGTSLPELAATSVAAWRGNDDIAVANILGSNVFNVLGIAGVTALVKPLPVPPEILARDDWWMLGLSLLLLPLMKSGMRIHRAEGGLLVLVFAAYLGVLLSGLA